MSAAVLYEPAYADVCRKFVRTLTYVENARHTLEARYEHVATRCYTLSYTRPSKNFEHVHNWLTYELRIDIRYSHARRTQQVRYAIVAHVARTQRIRSYTFSSKFNVSNVWRRVIAIYPSCPNSSCHIILIKKWF